MVKTKKFRQAFRIASLTVTFSCDDPTLCLQGDVNSLCKMNSCGDCTRGDTCGPASCNASVARRPKDTLKGFPQVAEIAESMKRLARKGKTNFKKVIEDFRATLDNPRRR